MKTLVIGDIHGCLSTLKALIAKAVPVASFFNIYGHTPTDYLGIKGAVPRISPTGINLDTGCVYDSLDRGKLTAVLLPSMEIIQQERLCE